MVNFEWYRSFVAVYQIGTVTGAAGALHLTQPAVSQHLASLEVSLGAKLFERKPRMMIPTDEGKALYSRIIGSITFSNQRPVIITRIKQGPDLLFVLVRH